MFLESYRMVSNRVRIAVVLCLIQHFELKGPTTDIRIERPFEADCELVSSKESIRTHSNTSSLSWQKRKNNICYIDVN